MRIAVIGGRGLIGRALAADLAAHGHQVVLGLRRIGDAPRDAIEVDYARPEPERWRRQLAGVDALVNAVGIFRERGAQRFEAIHVDGPLALFRAAAEAGVPRIVQISALGADPDSPLPYFSSKGRADAALLASPTDAAVVRPSLVFAPSGVSARGFLRLAALPLTPLPGGGRQPIQPLHLDDLCTGLRRLLEDPAQRGVVAAVGPAPLRLRDYLAALRRGLGLRGRLRVLPVPGALARAGA
ncbi:NAD(P)H-binding protein, partial [Vulcaniibacterium tengchongense]